MGFLPCSCSLPCNKTRSECQTKSINLQSESSSASSLLSQPSLPLVPSLSSPSQNPEGIKVIYHCLATLKCHSSYVSSLVLSGNSLFSGSSNGKIRVWPCEPPEDSIDTGDDRNVVAIGDGGVKSLVILGDKLISAHQDHKIRVWKIDEVKVKDQPHKYKCLATLPTINDRFTKLFSPKNYVQVRRHKKCTWVHHVDAVSSLALSQDGSILYSASWDRSFKIWRTSDFRCLESNEKAHEDAINALVVSRDGFVYTGSADKKIKVWSKKVATGSKKVATGNKKYSLVATLTKHLSAVNALAVSEDGKVLYSGACDRSILVWERSDDEEHMCVVGALRGHTKAILCLAVASELVFSGSADKSLRVWRRGKGFKEGYSCVAILEGHTKPVKCLSVVSMDRSGSSSGLNTDYTCMVYSGSLDFSIKIWKLQISFI